MRCSFVVIIYLNQIKIMDRDKLSKKGKGTFVTKFNDFFIFDTPKEKRFAD